jgi:hypothetical protein
MTKATFNNKQLLLSSMKINRKVRYIHHNNKENGLKFGQEYTILCIDKYGDTILVCNEVGTRFREDKTHFITLEQERIDNINKIINE